MNLLLIFQTHNNVESKIWINLNEILSVEQLPISTLIRFTNGQKIYTEEKTEEVVRRIRTFST